MKVSFTSISWFLSSVLNAQQSYPPQLPNAEILLYQEASDVELNLHVYKPADWTSENNDLAIVFYFGEGWVRGSSSHFIPSSTIMLTWV